MAFTSNTSSVQASSNESWKAQGFLNFYLPAADGGKRKKLGAIPLKESRSSEKEMLAWLNSDPSRVSIILAKLEIEYQSAIATTGSGFAL